MPFLHGRHIGPLLTVWVAALVVAGGLHWIEHLQPALDDMIAPLYIVVALAALWASVKWFRARAQFPDRRRAERRHSGRRLGE